MSSRRHHEPVAPQKDSYKVWQPPSQAESDHLRHKTATGHPENVDQVASGRRHSENKIRNPSRPDPYTPVASSYQNTPISSSSKTPQSSSRPSVPYISSKHPSQVASSTSQAHSHTQTSSRSHAPRRQPETYDPQGHVQKRATTGPSPQSSYEKVSGTEHARPVRYDSGQIVAVPSATSAPVIWVPPAQAPSSSSRRHREKEADKESIRYKEKTYDRSDRYREKENDKDEADVRRREREKMREREKLRERVDKEMGYREKSVPREKEKHRERGYETLEGKKDRSREQQRPTELGRDKDERERKYRAQEHVKEREYYSDKRKDGEREARSYGDPERVSRPSSSSARKGQNYRADDPDSSDSARRKPVMTSGHRRRHTDEGISSNLEDRRHRGDPSQYLASHATMGLGSSTTTVLSPGVARPTANDAHEVTPERLSPPTPRVMPVYLPDKKVKSQRSHHAVIPTLPESGLSGSDTERAKRRELRHPTTNHSSNLRGQHLEGLPRTLEDKPSSKPDVAQPRNPTEMSSTRVSNTELQKESKGLSSRWPFSRSRQSATPKPPENKMEGLPNTRERSVVQQSVSIRAGQGPSDPQISDVLYKPSASSHLEDQTKANNTHRPLLHPQDSRFVDTQRLDTSNSRFQTNVEHTLIPASESSAYAPNARPVRHESSSRHVSNVIASQRLVPSTTQPSRSTSHGAISSELRLADRAPALSKVPISQQQPAPPQISSRSASQNDNSNESRPYGSLSVDTVRQTISSSPPAPTIAQGKLASTSFAVKLNESQPPVTSVMSSGSTRHSPSAPLATAASIGPSYSIPKETQSREHPFLSETLTGLHTQNLPSRMGSSQVDSMDIRPSDPTPTTAQASKSSPAVEPVSPPPFQSSSISKYVADNVRPNETRHPAPSVRPSVREQVRLSESQPSNSVTCRQHPGEKGTPTAQTEPTLPYNEANYTPMGSKRDTWQVPQMPVSASQTTPQTTNHHSSKPTEPSFISVGSKRDIGEKPEAPQISASATQTTTQTTLRQSSESNHFSAVPKQDPAEKTGATRTPQISAPASQATTQIICPNPSEPSITQLGSKRDTGDAPQMSGLVSQTNAQISHYHTAKLVESTYNVGPKRDLGERTAAPQISVSAWQTAAQTHLHHPKSAPNSTPVDPKQVLLEKAATPQLPASTLQTMLKSPHHRSKVPDSISPNGSPILDRDSQATTPPALNPAGSKFNPVEGSTMAESVATISQSVSKASHTYGKSLEVTGLPNSSQVNTRSGTPASGYRVNLVPPSKLPLNEDSPPKQASHSQIQPSSSSHNATSREALSSDLPSHTNALSTSHQSMPTHTSPTLTRRSPSHNTQSNDARFVEQSQMPPTSSTTLQHISSKNISKETGMPSISTSRDVHNNAVSTLHSILESNSRTSHSPPVSQPPPTSRLYPQANDNHNAGQLHASAPASTSTAQEFPRQAQPYDTPLNLPAASSSAMMSRQITPASKPLAPQTNSFSMPSQATSRNNDVPRMTTQMPVYHSQSHTTLPEESAAVHVAQSKTYDQYSSLQAASELRSPTTPQPSASRIQEGAKKTQENYSTHITHATALLATSSNAGRSTPKPYVSTSQNVDMAARTREVSANQSNFSQSHSIPHRSTPSTSQYNSSQQASSTTHHHQHTVSLPSLAVPFNSTTMPQPGNSRTQSHTLPRSSASSTQAASTSTRVPASNHLSVPQMARSASSDSELLKTPSSLAPSMLLKPISSGPTAVSSQTPPESRGKDSRFRLKKPGDSQPYEIWNPPASTKTPDRNEIRSQERPPEQSYTRSGPTPREKTSAPVNIPMRPSGRDSPEPKVFTPFRLFTSRRHRTVSAASLDATDGTATNTLMGSPTTSIHSQALMPPPFRDPLAAAHEWRNNEEAQMKGRGTGRRRRPGVTFDVQEDRPEEPQE